MIVLRRSSSFKEDESTWKGNDDGKVVNNQPQRVMMDNGCVAGGYIGRITNDDREVEMEDNMGQVNTMIGNLRNMAIDMGSELENQNRQVDRINLKVLCGSVHCFLTRTTQHFTYPRHKLQFSPPHSPNIDKQRINSCSCKLVGLFYFL